jgi:BASS family bile acid:Na+ symporter
MTAEQLNQLINVLATVTLVEMMVAIGLGVTVAELAGVAKDWRLVGRAALANYVCFPAAAVGLLLVFQSDPLIAAGFLIAAVCPGAPYGPPFTGLARGNVAVAVGLMVLLAGSSAIVAPLLLRVLLPVTSGDVQGHVDAGQMVGTLLTVQFLPLCVGLAVRHRRPALAARLKKPAGLLSMVLNLATLAVVIGVQFDMLVGIPVRAFAGMFALVLAGLAAGWLLGGPGNDARTAMAMATAVRNVGVGLVIATISFPGTPAVTATTAFAIFQTVVLAVVALAWGRLATASVGGAGAPAAPDEGVATRAAPGSTHAAM